MQSRAAKFGEWYFSVVCEDCFGRILLFPDQSEGTSEVARVFATIRCPHCGKDGTYKLEQYQEPFA